MSVSQDVLERAEIGPPPEPFDRIPARIGLLFFKYDNPLVDVTSEQRTVEQETIDDTVVVQTIGRKPDQITVNATVADWELVLVDSLTKIGEVSLRTERWSGDVVVESTSTDPLNARDSDGAWLYEATIECKEVEKSAASRHSIFNL